MTYNTYEASQEDGAPIELYEFTQGVKRWTYTTSADSYIRLGQVYTPSPIKRDNVKQTTDTFKDALKLTFPRDDPFASQYIAFAPEDVTTLTLYRGHYGDPNNEFIVYWKGRVVGAKISGNTIEVQCESIFTSIKRPGLRARYEYGCRRTLYMKGCNVNRELFKLEGAVLSLVNSISLTVAGAANKPNGYFTGGMLIAEDNSARYITLHQGDNITMSRPLPSLSGSQTVKLYPGCDHLKETCKNKFNNLDNFGGFPWIPVKNPYGGSSIT